jgi:hypothetical protein
MMQDAINLFIEQALAEDIGTGDFTTLATIPENQMQKLKLKTDADGNKTTTVNGIRASCKVMKTRYNKPFETLQIEIPYETGMSQYSGLFDMFETMSLLKKDGNSYTYTKIDGSIIKKFRKAWNANDDGCLDTIMEEFYERNHKVDLVVSEEEDSKK